MDVPVWSENEMGLFGPDTGRKTGDADMSKVGASTTNTPGVAGTGTGVPGDDLSPADLVFLLSYLPRCNSLGRIPRGKRGNALGQHVPCDKFRRYRNFLHIFAYFLLCEHHLITKPVTLQGAVPATGPPELTGVPTDPDDE
jgi:hypothetical protein